MTTLLRDAALKVLHVIPESVLWTRQWKISGADPGICVRGLSPPPLLSPFIPLRSRVPLKPSMGSGGAL